MKAFNKKKKPRYRKTFSIICIHQDEYGITKTQYVIKNNKLKIMRNMIVEENDVKKGKI